MSPLSSSLYRTLAIPAVDFFRKTESVESFRELDKTQWWPREKLEQLQLTRLKKLLIHAQSFVPFYRDIFHACGFDATAMQSVSDMSAIPLLTKDIIRSEGPRMLAENAAEFSPRAHRSAGTTGQPIVIQMDRARHSVAWADMYRWWGAGGWHIGDKQYVVAGAALRPRHLSGFKAKVYSKLNHFEDYTAFELTREKMDRLLSKLAQENGQAFVRGYASSIHTLARYASEMEWRGNVRAIFTTAETLFADQRKQIESGLHGPVFDQWGCRDGGISAFECEKHNGMHLAIENSLVEICRDGVSLPVGESGDVVATDLFCYAMPIIRYHVGDVAAMSNASCSCGRGLPLVASVQGRVSGFLLGSGGRKVHGEFFSHVFWETPWVKEFQIVQDIATEIMVNIVPSSTPPQDSMQEITKLMSERVGADVRIRVEIVNDIPPGPMGKRQFVICRVPQTL